MRRLFNFPAPLWDCRVFSLCEIGLGSHALVTHEIFLRPSKCRNGVDSTLCPRDHNRSNAKPVFFSWSLGHSKWIKNTFKRLEKGILQKFWKLFWLPGIKFVKTLPGCWAYSHSVFYKTVLSTKPDLFYSMLTGSMNRCFFPAVEYTFCVKTALSEWRNNFAFNGSLILDNSGSSVALRSNLNPYQSNPFQKLREHEVPCSQLQPEFLALAEFYFKSW